MRTKKIQLLLAIFITAHVTIAAHSFEPKTDTKESNKNLQFRILHFALKRVSLEDARIIVNSAYQAGFNTIQVQISDGLRLDNAPWEAEKNAWSKADFSGWVSYARTKGIDIIPELQLLTHQENFFQGGHPDLMYNNRTYDPENEKTYNIVFSTINEIISSIQPKAFHIGHDELAGFNSNIWLNQGEKRLPSDLFLKDILRIYDYLKMKNIDTWIWGDMLISPEEFPGMQPNNMHGTAPGYGKAMRDKLPKDIIICDWHYNDRQLEFQTLNTMQKEGFKVIGVTWKDEENIKKFSQYASEHGAYGMMATTWYHVQRRQWDIVEKIISTSGEAFRKSYADEKETDKK